PKITARPSRPRQAMVNIEHAGAKSGPGPHTTEAPPLIEHAFGRQSSQRSISNRIQPGQSSFHFAIRSRAPHTCPVSTHEARPFANKHWLDPGSEPLERTPDMAGNDKVTECRECLTVKYEFALDARWHRRSHLEHSCVGVRKPGV